MAFYISKVTAIGSGKTPASVEFNSGLNIICGVSDSGKTCVLKCIQFAMGILKIPFDKAKTGYDSVYMEVVTPTGKIIFSRSLGKNIVNVVSEVNGIDGGDYDITYKPQGNNRPILNELWLKLIGIDELPMIIKNQHFERQRLQWNTLTDLFWLKEQEIENPKSVLLPDTVTQHPYFFSCLLYLLTGNNYAEMEQQEKEEISAAKRNAVQQFVNAQIAQMSAKRENLQNLLSDFGNLDVEAEMQKLIDNLSETEDAIAAATEESKDLLSTLLSFKEQEAELAMTYNQFQSLKSQYTADIKRLTFIADSEVHMHSIAENTSCPFCNGKIQPRRRKSYIATAKAELARIISQLQGLTESENDISCKLNITREKIQTLETRIKEIDTLVDSELIPHAEGLRTAITQYRAYIEIKHEVEILHTLSTEWNTELQKQTIDDHTDKPKFKPKDQFPEDFNTSIDEISYAILESCQYEGLNTAHFNIGTFDLEVNGLKKEVSHGKGYWAFINTVLGLSFRQYLHESAVYKPDLFVVDTPLLGLDQGVENSAPSSMRTALFQYFMNHQSEGQIIVVENTKDLPDLDYEKSGASVIEFTQDKYNSRFSESRYGFLYDVFSEKDSCEEEQYAKNQL